jgi:multidrug efflux pump subunit AcrA (membrane-fusion protein)
MNASWQGKRWWALAAAVAALGGGGWLARRPWRGAENLPTAAVRRGDLSEFVRCRGKLAVRQAAFLIVPRGVENLRIVFLAPGGSRVRRGQVVIRLDVSGLQQKARQRALALRTARAKLSQAETQTQITHQQDLLALVEDQVAAGRAQLQARRESILSRIAGQESRLALATAQAKVTAQQAEARLHAAAAVAQLQALRQARDKAAAELRREQSVIAAATLRAPSAGLVTYDELRQFHQSPCLPRWRFGVRRG